MNKRFILCILSIALIIFLILLGPMDFFRHGYFCEELNFEEAKKDYGQLIDLKNGEYEMCFSPLKRYFTGMEIILENEPEDNSGKLVVSIKDDGGKLIESVKVALSEVKNKQWYMIYTSKKLEKGKKYFLQFATENCTKPVSLISIDEDYLGEETIDGNAAIAFAYKESTFDLSSKILIFIFILSLWLIIYVKLSDVKHDKIMINAALFMLMTEILTWNYMYNSMDNLNEQFDLFQEVSETLVTGPILAEEQKARFIDTGYHQYGLGRYVITLGEYKNYELLPITDENWNQGYSNSEPAILVATNRYTAKIVKDLAKVKFSNGDKFSVKEVVKGDTSIIIKLKSDKILNYEKYGEIGKVKFFDSQGKAYPSGELIPYRSQYGLQGKVFRHIARILDKETELVVLRLICAMATAIVLTVIVVLIAAHYNSLMAAVFFLTFWLSPWIVNFARNLYWVEFTWFAPMAVGLFCAWKINDKRCRILSYAAAFVAITCKCLCGYEYISTIMMGLIAFLLIDFIGALGRKDKEQSKLLLKTIFIIGIMALLGFAVAICIHAPMRADGNLFEGIENIFTEDVLRRTSGIDLNEFHEELYINSSNASVWEVFCMYFKFSTQVVTGIPGNLFPLLCLIPLGIFIYDYKQHKLNLKHTAMYIIFFLTTVSWFCLAKSHSYIHPHMNYVMWYFGFVQTCFYIIINKIQTVLKMKSE